jgi:hypothetical protein
MVLARAVFGPAVESPLGEFAIGLLGLAIFASAIVMVWWIWRIYRGDPPRNPKIPSKRVLIAAAVLFTAWAVAIQFVEPRGTATVIDRPWLREPVPITYPQEVEIVEREAVVEVSLFISASGEVQRYEFTSAADSDLQAAVADAIRRMQVDTDELDADSYPFEKRLRIQFVHN